MHSDGYSENDYGQPHIPPATSPMIDSNAGPHDAAALASVNGDSDFPGTRTAAVERGDEDQDISPGGSPDEFTPQEPDEIVPDQGEEVEPSQQPDEITPDQGDTDEPGQVPVETPPL